MVQQHNLTKIRALLNEGFSDEELRQLIFDVPVLKPVFNQLAHNTNKAQIVQKLLEFADQKELIEILLDQVKERNPAKYEKYQPYHEISTDPVGQSVNEIAPIYIILIYFVFVLESSLSKEERKAQEAGENLKSTVTNSAQHEKKGGDPKIPPFPPDSPGVFLW